MSVGKRFREWLYWKLFPEQAETLHRYRVQIQQLDRWFASDPPIVEVLTWIRHTSEPTIPKDEVWSGLHVSGLRDRVRRLLAPSQKTF